jgi:hypothetical protein
MTCEICLQDCNTILPICDGCASAVAHIMQIKDENGRSPSQEVAAELLKKALRILTHTF